MTAKTKIIKIERAEHIGAHKLKLYFSNGREQIVDFGPFLKTSLHPEIRKFLRPQNFKLFSIKNGDLMWGDFDLIFPIMDLYENRLSP